MKADELSKASKDLMLREPFYGLLLLMLNKEWTKDKVPTAGVGKNNIGYKLYINEEFWQSLTHVQRISLLKHELLHIGFFHLTDFEHLTNKEIANYAMDLEINQYITESELPPGPVLLSSFPELNLLPKKGTNYYYDALTKAKNNGTSPNLDSMLESGNSPGMSIKISIGDGKETDVNIPDHSTWKEFDGLNEATQKLIRKQTEHILKEVAEQTLKTVGSIPGEFKEILDKITNIEPPKFDWRGYLRRFSGNSTKIYTKKSRRKYNKRYSDNPGLKIKQRCHALIAIDTSASVRTDELKEFLNEIYHIQKTGLMVTIAQADTAISHIGEFNPRKDLEIHGRGGTSFQPVIDYYNENTHKYTCLIYLTDGEAATPTPARGPMLWVMSSVSKINENLIGQQIKLN